MTVASLPRSLEGLGLVEGVGWMWPQVNAANVEGISMLLGRYKKESFSYGDPKYRGHGYMAI
jgi:hypothetical protein